MAELEEKNESRIRRFVVAVTGASGAIYGLNLLKALRNTPDIETHLVVSPTGWRTIAHELDMGPREFAALADYMHDASDVGATIASGSFRCEGMVVAPCSMHTLAAIAHGLANSLLTRAADVMLKERRKLVLLARETPLHLVHLRNMQAVTEMGAIVMPPVPAFYLKPHSIEDIVDHTVSRVLDQFDVPHRISSRWRGAVAEAEARH
jgi:polyprenyl P-hydroxybenzoate/phenylacrylic acid decarboxylase-like protein